MTKVYSYDGQLYQQRPPQNEVEGYILASTISGAILSPLAYISGRFDKQLKKEIPNNWQYKDSLEKALELSGLKKKGVDILRAQDESVPRMFQQGENAAFEPLSKKIIINTDKISIAGFHELGHAMNALKSKFGLKYLQRMRYPGYAIAGLMEYFAIFSRKKPKGAPRSVTDIIEDNCGKIAFAAMLPIAIEEAIASIRGIKLARKSGVSEPLIKNMKKLYAKAFMTYGGRAVLGGLAVFASRKIMDYYTRPKPIENYYF